VRAGAERTGAIGGLSRLRGSAGPSATGYRSGSRGDRPPAEGGILAWNQPCCRSSHQGRQPAGQAGACSCCTGGRPWCDSPGDRAARRLGWPVVAVAPVDRYPQAAGPIRNRKMLKRGEAAAAVEGDVLGSLRPFPGGGQDAIACAMRSCCGRRRQVGGRVEGGCTEQARSAGTGSPVFRAQVPGVDPGERKGRHIDLRVCEEDERQTCSGLRLPRETRFFGPRFLGRGKISATRWRG